VPSIPGEPQNPISPAPTRTPVDPLGTKLWTASVRTGLGAIGAAVWLHEANNHSKRIGDTRIRTRAEELIRFTRFTAGLELTDEPKRKASP
jgi:hypothetical protein